MKIADLMPVLLGALRCRSDVLWCARAASTYGQHGIEAERWATLLVERCLPARLAVNRNLFEGYSQFGLAPRVYIPVPGNC